jgi:hypothetical protein
VHRRGLREGRRAGVARCVAPTRFSGGFTLGSGPATVDGVSYAKLWCTGVLAFDGETMAFPGRSSSVDLTSPFSLVSEGFWVSVRSSRGISQTHTPASHVGCPRQSAALDGACRHTDGMQSRNQYVQ